MPTPEKNKTKEEQSINSDNTRKDLTGTKKENDKETSKDEKLKDQRPSFLKENQLLLN